MEPASRYKDFEKDTHGPSSAKPCSWRAKSEHSHAASFSNSSQLLQHQLPSSQVLSETLLKVVGPLLYSFQTHVHHVQSQSRERSACQVPPVKSEERAISHNLLWTVTAIPVQIISLPGSNFFLLADRLVLRFQLVCLSGCTALSSLCSGSFFLSPSTRKYWYDGEQTMYCLARGYQGLSDPWICLGVG